MPANRHARRQHPAPGTPVGRHFPAEPPGRSLAKCAMQSLYTVRMCFFGRSPAARLRARHHHLVARMLFSSDRGSKLCCEEVTVLFDLEELGLLVELIDLSLDHHPR